MRSGKLKGRKLSTYQKKVDKITCWHNKLSHYREKSAEINPNTKLIAKRRELQPLEYYIEKIKKPNK